jgi:hypothetical protein
MLATQLTPDGKGIVANDPLSGQQVILKYSQGKIGGIVSMIDPKTNTPIPFPNNRAAVEKDFIIQDNNYNACPVPRIRNTFSRLISQSS